MRQQHGTVESAYANPASTARGDVKAQRLRPGQSLPDVRHKRWHDQNGRRLRRDISNPSRPMDTLASQADGAFDEAGQQKDRSNHRKQ
jgi:hypothetical protein